ncbi:hypothetical protein VNI00_010698 [Paramarasmius palmivorus]|uniref:BTB domain-containing protein n=1 Tax=Paramarasmius palmivorus TaxID=297713 RepID=A0AAW0CDG3_9AGAR
MDLYRRLLHCRGSLDVAIAFPDDDIPLGVHSVLLATISRYFAYYFGVVEPQDDKFTVTVSYATKATAEKLFALVYAFDDPRNVIGPMKASCITETDKAAQSDAIRSMFDVLELAIRWDMLLLVPVLEDLLISIITPSTVLMSTVASLPPHQPFTHVPVTVYTFASQHRFQVVLDACRYHLSH